MITMTLQRFEQLLKKVNPRFRVRQKSYGDVVGLYCGPHYILRMTKGELNFNGYRLQIQNPEDPLNPIQGRIMTRGRKTIISILRSHRWVTKRKDTTMLLYGIEK